MLSGNTMNRWISSGLDAASRRYVAGYNIWFQGTFIELWDDSRSPERSRFGIVLSCRLLQRMDVEPFSEEFR